MQRKLQSCGNGWELYISKPILKLLSYDPKEVRLLVKFNDNALTLEPITNPDEYPNSMIRKLRKSGGSYGIYMPLPLIEVLGVNPEEDFIEMTIMNNKILLKKPQQ